MNLVRLDDDWLTMHFRTYQVGTWARAVKRCLAAFMEMGPDFVPRRQDLTWGNRESRRRFKPGDTTILDEALATTDRRSLDFYGPEGLHRDIDFTLGWETGRSAIGGRVPPKLVNAHVGLSFTSTPEGVDKLLRFAGIVFEEVCPYFGSIHESSDWLTIKPELPDFHWESHCIESIYWATFLGHGFVDELGLDRILSSPA